MTSRFNLCVTQVAADCDHSPQKSQMASLLLLIILEMFPALSWTASEMQLLSLLMATKSFCSRHAFVIKKTALAYWSTVPINEDNFIHAHTCPKSVLGGSPQYQLRGKTLTLTDEWTDASWQFATTGESNDGILWKTTYLHPRITKASFSTIECFILICLSGNISYALYCILCFLCLFVLTSSKMKVNLNIDHFFLSRYTWKYYLKDSLLKSLASHF